MELRQITPSIVRTWHGRLAKSDLHANTVAKVAEAIHPRFTVLVWVGATSGLRFGGDDPLLRPPPRRRHLNSHRADRVLLSLRGGDPAVAHISDQTFMADPAGRRWAWLRAPGHCSAHSLQEVLMIDVDEDGRGARTGSGGCPAQRG